MFLIYSEQVVNEISTTSTLSGEDAYEGNMWTRSSLIAIRDLEAPVRGSPEFGQYCWSDSTIVAPVSPRAESNPTFSDVVCHKGSFLSPLYLLYFSGYLPNDLETITQEELDEALKKTIEDENAWANFSNLFDKEVTADNLKVRYLRTQIVFAGPFQYETEELDARGQNIFERYEDKTDRLVEQIAMVTDFQLRISNSIEFDNENYYPTVKR